MNWLRSPLAGQIRAALALLLVLAGLAGARMQGAMATGVGDALAFGLLCSGERIPAEGGGAPATHDCILCNLPVSAGAVENAAVARPHSGFAVLAPAAVKTGTDHAAVSVYRSRAPPLVFSV